MKKRQSACAKKNVRYTSIGKELVRNIENEGERQDTCKRYGKYGAKRRGGRTAKD